MGFDLMYVPESGPPIEGDRLGSATGWNGWCEWVLSLSSYYPECAHLANEGDLEPPEALAELEHELEQLAHEQSGTPDQKAVAARLLETVRARPPGTVGILVTDGEAGHGLTGPAVGG